MQDKVEPVEGPDKTALKEHGQLFHNVRRFIRGETESETEDDYDAPGQLIDEVLHTGSIAQKGRLKARKSANAVATVATAVTEFDLLLSILS